MVNLLTFEMLQITNLTKQFKKIKAVDNISLKVQKGDIYGFLGPNGAGKTTSIRMIMGIIKPDNGIIKLNASDINSINRRKLGYLPEDRGLYQKQNLSEILYYFGCLKGLDKKDSKNRANLWLERFNLDDQKKRKVEELSKGNQQKIQFIIALLHDPQLIILDEPFTGLDPVNQILLKEVIKEKQEEGKTIIFSTHQMEQVERLCRMHQTTLKRNRSFGSSWHLDPKATPIISSKGQIIGAGILENARCVRCCCRSYWKQLTHSPEVHAAGEQSLSSDKSYC